MGQTNDDSKPILAILWDNFWLVGGITCLVTLIGLAYTFLAKPVWEASATIVFPAKSPSILGVSGMGDQTSLAATLTGGPSPLKIYKGYIESERTVKMVADATGLKRKAVVQARKIVDQTMESSLTVSARSLDAELSKKIVQAHLDALTKINTEVNDPLYEDDAQVLAKKLAEQRTRVDGIERQLLNFQQNSITAPSVTSSGVGKEATVMANPSRWQDLQRQLEVGIQKVNANIRAVRRQVSAASGKSDTMPSNLPPVRKWRDKLVDLEYELKIKELTFGKESPEIVQLQEAVAETRKNLKSEIKAYAGAIASGAIDPTSSEDSIVGLTAERFGLEAQLEAVKRLAQLAPSESITLSRLTREMATQSLIMTQLQSQYELAKLQEMRNPNRWHILDEPEVAEDPVNKSLFKTGVLACLLGLILGMIAALIADGRQSKDQELVESRQWKEAA